MAAFIMNYGALAIVAGLLILAIAYIIKDLREG